jgi:hypothetical protein
VTDADNLPAKSGHSEAATRDGAPLAPAVHDAIVDLQQVWTAVGRLTGADVSATVHPAVVCAGSTTLETVLAIVAFVRESPHAEIHNVGWARVLGPVEGTWEYQATLYVSYADTRGEYSGATHIADRRR